MYEAFIRADKAFNHNVLGGYWNQTVSRNAGSKIGRSLGTDTQTGTDLFHAGLAVVGVGIVAGVAALLSR